MTEYPNSGCDEHRNVKTSEPVCIICMAEEIERLERVADLAALSPQGAYSAEEVRELLREKAKEAGSQKALAKTIGVSDQFVSDILLGKREPSGKPLEFLGLRRSSRYEPSNAE